MTKALRAAQAKAPRLVKIEIEVTTLEQLEEAIREGAHMVLLDNMDDATLRKAVNSKAYPESSRPGARA